MGHVLTSEGLKPDPDKIQAVSKIPKPTCKQETHSSVGFVNYLTKFLPRLSEIAHPIRATLLQNGQPVAFASRTLSQVEQCYAQIEKECLEIIFACTKFSQYITRRAVITVETDHKPLQSIFKKSLLTAPSRLQRM